VRSESDGGKAAVRAVDVTLFGTRFPRYPALSFDRIFWWRLTVAVSPPLPAIGMGPGSGLDFIIHNSRRTPIVWELNFYLYG
jgi:hypothetical protein